MTKTGVECRRFPTTPRRYSIVSRSNSVTDSPRISCLLQGQPYVWDAKYFAKDREQKRIGNRRERKELALGRITFAVRKY